MPERKRKNSLARQILIVLTVVFFALSIVYIVALYTHPNRVFMDNIILNLIVEKHTPQEE
ncbi:MAG TPA: hypothetical protein PK364_06275 [Synergistaceae bacterium]|nr:hypothetical protein [Synergistaceae bacterium]HPJ25097.1 hypothetical protein [Synergistaceae bacterium]HPQ36576.1 hypothetical protein [Synergistaceae bacterium]